MASNGASELPLTPPLLLEVLQAACSSSQQLVSQAAEQLKKWEKQKGYFSLLQDAFYDKSLPLEVRWISIIQLKNGVDKYWRTSQPNAISKEEKATIRSKLLNSIDEESSQLTRTNAIVIGKVARIDYPNNWPDLFHNLIGAIRDMSTGADGAVPNTRLETALILLLAVIKEQAAGRLARTKANLHAIAPELYRVLGELYLKYVEAWTTMIAQNPNSDDPAIASTLSVSLITLKILRRLTVSGYEFPNRAEEVKQLWIIFRNQLASFIQLTGSNISGIAAQQKLIRKHVTSLGKLYLEVSQLHAPAFALLPDTLEVLRTYWEVILAYGEELGVNAERIRARLNNGEEIDSGVLDDPERSQYIERVALHGALLLRNCAKSIFNPTQTFRYKHKEEKEETEQAKNVFRTQLFTPQMVTQCMEVLVTRYFILSPNDIEEWTNDPEGWSTSMEDTTESWEFMIRPCAEKLFGDLINWFKDLLVPPLVSVFNSSSSQDILTKDAIYTAVGLSASQLHSHIDFDSYLQNTLVNEVQIAQPGYNIIRRRIAILIGQWVPVKISVEARGTIYKITQFLLNREDGLNDLVVRLAAARNLKCSVDEWDFKMEDFIPYVDDLFSKVLALIDEVESTETKMALLGVISVIVERLGPSVVAYAERIIAILPPLWDQTGEEHLFKQAILAVLTKLVAAMGEKSIAYNSLLINMIRFSVEPGPMQVYLLEEALELWDALLKSTPAPASPDLLALIDVLLPSLEPHSDTLKRILDVTEGYVLLAPREIMDLYGLPLFSRLAALLGTVKPEASSILTTIVEMCIRVADLISGETGVKSVATQLMDSTFLPRVFAAVRVAYDARQTTGPNKQYERVNTLIETHYFELFSRLALASPSLFAEILAAIASQRNESEHETWTWLLDEWCSHFPNIGHPRPRKLNCLALTRLLASQRPEIFRRLQDLMTIWTDVITELRDDEASQGESLIYWAGPGDGAEEGGPERERRRELGKGDAVNTVGVGEFVGGVLRGVVGSAGWEESVGDVDASVRSDFGRLGVI